MPGLHNPETGCLKMAVTLPIKMPFSMEMVLVDAVAIHSIWNVSNRTNNNKIL